MSRLLGYLALWGGLSLSLLSVYLTIWYSVGRLTGWSRGRHGPR